MCKSRLFCIYKHNLFGVFLKHLQMTFFSSFHNARLTLYSTPLSFMKTSLFFIMMKYQTIFPSFVNGLAKSFNHFFSNNFILFTFSISGLCQLLCDLIDWNTLTCLINHIIKKDELKLVSVIILN